MCAGECTSTTEIEPTACLGSSGYPSKFWANLDEQGKSYTQRVCCTKDGSASSTSNECASESKKKKGGLSTGGAIAIGVCVPILLIAFALGIGFWQKSKSAAPQNQTPAASAPPPMAVAEPVEPPPPGYVSGAQAAAMARGEVIGVGQPEGGAAIAPEPEQWAPEAEK